MLFHFIPFLPSYYNSFSSNPSYEGMKNLKIALMPYNEFIEPALGAAIILILCDTIKSFLGSKEKLKRYLFLIPVCSLIIGVLLGLIWASVYALPLGKGAFYGLLLSASTSHAYKVQKEIRKKVNKTE